MKERRLTRFGRKLTAPIHYRPKNTDLCANVFSADNNSGATTTGAKRQRAHGSIRQIARRTEPAYLHHVVEHDVEHHVVPTLEPVVRKVWASPSCTSSQAWDFGMSQDARFGCVDQALGSFRSLEHIGNIGDGLVEVVPEKSRYCSAPRLLVHCEALPEWEPNTSSCV